MISPETLRRYPFFAGLQAAAFKDIAMLGDDITLEPGEWLFHEGDDATYLFLIEEGSIDLKVKLGGPAARYADLETLVPGEIVGWSALIEPYVFTLGAVATSHARLIRLDAAALQALMDKDCEVGYALAKNLALVLSQRLSNLRTQFVSMMPDA